MNSIDVIEAELDGGDARLCKVARKTTVRFGMGGSTVRK